MRSSYDCKFINSQGFNDLLLSSALIDRMVIDLRRIRLLSPRSSSNSLTLRFNVLYVVVPAA